MNISEWCSTIVTDVNLTLTRVVFESTYLYLFGNISNNLTLTRVVFEFEMDEEVIKKAEI